MEVKQFESNEDWILSVAEDVVASKAKRCCIVYETDDGTVSMTHFGFNIDNPLHMAILAYPSVALLLEKHKTKWSLTKQIWRYTCITVDSAFFWFNEKKKRGDIAGGQ